MVLTAFWGGYRRHDGIRVVLSFSSRWGPLPDALSNQLQMAQEFRRELMFQGKIHMPGERHVMD